jgi:hypothetical protein
MDYVTAQALYDYFTPGDAWLVDELLHTDAASLFRLPYAADWPPPTIWDIRHAPSENALSVLHICTDSIRATLAPYRSGGKPRLNSTI